MNSLGRNDQVSMSSTYFNIKLDSATRCKSEAVIIMTYETGPTVTPESYWPAASISAFAEFLCIVMPWISQVYTPAERNFTIKASASLCTKTLQRH